MKCPVTQGKWVRITNPLPENKETFFNREGTVEDVYENARGHYCAVRLYDTQMPCVPLFLVLEVEPIRAPMSAEEADQQQRSRLAASIESNRPKRSRKTPVKRKKVAA